MMPGKEIEPGTHWWEVSALTTVPSLLPRERKGSCTRHVQGQMLRLTSSNRAKWTGVESVRSLKNDGSHTVQSTHFSKPMATTGNLQKVRGKMEVNGTSHMATDIQGSIFFILVTLLLDNEMKLSKQIITSRKKSSIIFPDQC